MKPSAIKALLDSPLFKSVDESTAKKLFSISGVNAVEAKKDAEIYSPDSFERLLGVIVRGSAVVEKRTDGKSIIMSTLEKGGTFGMAALFYERDDFPTVITATKDCTVVFFTKQWLTEAFKIEPTLTENYISLLSRKIHFLTDKIEALSAKSGSSKLYSYILDEYRRSGENGEVTLRYNMSELSRVLGIGRTTLYRELSDLTESGIISKQGKKIILGTL